MFGTRSYSFSWSPCYRRRHTDMHIQTHRYNHTRIYTGTDTFFSSANCAHHPDNVLTLSALILIVLSPPTMPSTWLRSRLLCALASSCCRLYRCHSEHTATLNVLFCLLFQPQFLTCFQFLICFQFFDYFWSRISVSHLFSGFCLFYTCTMRTHTVLTHTVHAHTVHAHTVDTHTLHTHTVHTYSTYAYCAYCAYACCTYKAFSFSLVLSLSLV